MAEKDENGDLSISDSGLDLIEQLPNRQGLPPASGRLRRAIGRVALPGFMRIITDVVLGTFDHDSHSNSDVASFISKISDKENIFSINHASTFDIISMFESFSKEIFYNVDLPSIADYDQGTICIYNNEVFELIRCLVSSFHFNDRLKSWQILVGFIENMSAEDHAMFLLIWGWAREIPSVREGIVEKLSSAAAVR